MGAKADFCIKSAAARSRLVGCSWIKQVETRRDLELRVVVGEGVRMEVVSPHELLQILQMPHAGQVATKYLGAGAVRVREVVAMLSLHCRVRKTRADPEVGQCTCIASTPDISRMAGK
jgi:hypothetical protein